MATPNLSPYLATGGGIGYTDGSTAPPPNGNSSIWTLIVINQTSKLVLPRERELDMALYAANSKIKTLNKDNISRDVHANESQRDFIELQKIIQMSIINDTQFEIIFHGSRILQGQDYHLYIEYYKNNTLAPDIQPWPFIVRFAEENVTSIKPTENELQPTMASVNYSSTAGNTTAGKKGAKPTEKETQLPFSPGKGNTTAGKKDAKPTEKETPSNGLVHTRNPGRSPPSSSNTLILVLAISGSILVVFIVLCIIYLLWRLKNKKRSRIGADERGIEGGGCELQDIV